MLYVANFITFILHSAFARVFPGWEGFDFVTSRPMLSVATFIKFIRVERFARVFTA